MELGIITHQTSVTQADASYMLEVATCVTLLERKHTHSGSDQARLSSHNDR